MAVVTFTGANNGVWSTTSNWSGSAVPQAGDTADLGTKNVEIDADMKGGATLPMPAKVINGSILVNRTVAQIQIGNAGLGPDFSAVVITDTGSRNTQFKGGTYGLISDKNTGGNDYNDCIISQVLHDAVGGQNRFGNCTVGTYTDNSTFGQCIFTGGTYSVVNDNSGGGTLYSQGSFGTVTDNSQATNPNLYQGGTFNYLIINSTALVNFNVVSPASPLTIKSISLDGGSSIQNLLGSVARQYLTRMGVAFTR